MPTDIVLPRAIKFRENKDVGYIGRLVNGIINIFHPALLSLSRVAFLHNVRELTRDTLADNLCEIMKSSFTTSCPLAIFEFSGGEKFSFR